MAKHIASERRQPRQFTLGGLMSFVVGWSAYCSVIATVWSWLESDFSLDEEYRRPSGWLMGVTVAACWIVLWLLYRRWGLRHALRIHYTGPIIFTPLAALVSLAGILGALGDRHTIDPTFFFAPLLVALYGCLISIVIGFPIAVIMLFFVVPSSRRSGREPPRVGRPTSEPTGR